MSWSKKIKELFGLVAAMCPSCGYYCTGKTAFCPEPSHKCGEDCKHDSDCALHNGPAMRIEACNCSLSKPPKE